MLGENEIRKRALTKPFTSSPADTCQGAFFYKAVYSKSTPLSFPAAMLSRTLQLLDRHSALGTPITFILSY